MTIIATGLEDPPPPPPRRRRPPARPPTRPVKVRARMLLYEEWSDLLRLPDGQLAIVEHVTMTRAAWVASCRAAVPGWRWRANGHLVTAYRVVFPA